eukprot:scaffold8830_cov64-Phaeocystis_antarctica.AAC.2
MAYARVGQHPLARPTETSPKRRWGTDFGFRFIFHLLPPPPSTPPAPPALSPSGQTQIDHIATTVPAHDTPSLHLLYA